VATNRVGEILDHYPELLETFLAFGFKPLANPILRRTIARYVTLAQACRQLRLDLESFLAALNAQREPQATGRRSLPVLTGR
jgi:hypothetical protein